MGGCHNGRSEGRPGGGFGAFVPLEESGHTAELEIVEGEGGEKVNR